ncbi:TPA: tyrosine-type recombinase/integrase [Escherichia coli]|nr:hypothetical protein [Salmonella enterica]EET9801507.1 tyrosine-type recombinase/integrase [Escherichia coli]ECP5664087.1 tyrosine-type recombinase/integrase [Salmonella enterica]EFH3605658.1 tyrosine-type recombinase/integrase [Escherichia coli]EGD7796072.1 hypothetical protein [Escherichia coli]
MTLVFNHLSDSFKLELRGKGTFSPTSFDHASPHFHCFNINRISRCPELQCHIISQWLQVRLRSPSADSPWFFPSRNGPHITRQRFWQIIRAYAVMAGLAVRVHPHMLRHACGFALAERGNDTRLIQDYLGHKNIRHTVRYTATSPARFRQTWIHPPCHTLSPDNTPPEHDVRHTGYHIRSSSAHILPPHLSVIHHEYGNMMKNICRELDNIQHILKRMDARATAG